jgi:hypothetical protein
LAGFWTDTSGVNGCPLSPAEYRASQLSWPGTYPIARDTTATFSMIGKRS